MSDGLVGVLIGSGITCIGYIFVWLQGLAERKHRMRYEVHLAASEGLGACFRYVGSASRTDVSDEQLNELLAASQLWSTKVKLVSDQETVEALNTAFECFVKFSMSIQRPRLKLRRALTSIQLLDDEKKANVARISQVAALTEELHRQGKNQDYQNAIAYYMPLLEQVQAREKEIVSESKTLRVEVVKLQKELLESSLQFMAEFQTLVSEATILLRSELGVKTKGSRFKTMLETSQKKVQQDLKLLIEDFAKIANDDLNKN
ncbi:MAG: hypothetical protein IT366_02410 [Candidatus Hydrogenedentes bacterium]|nr:hypothetical protein [Candidatus Hydrogenedentota bacterium]